MQIVRALRRLSVASAAAALLAQPVIGQDAPKPATPGFDFSGVLFGNFQMKSDSASKAAIGGQQPNQFQIERVYLNFRMPAGEDGSIRVTTDIFNNSSACGAGCYQGWTARLKYAYFQYNFLHDIGDQKGFNAVARIGMLHTVQIDHEEGFWPRYLSQTAIERNAFFSSSDLGVAGLLTLPAKWGEVYATITNGTGYSQTELDPYKDYAARLSLTPWGGDNGFAKTITISPYVYMGKTASKFINGGTGQVGPVTDGLTKNRMGVFVGVKDRRFTAGADFGQRTETIETGSNTSASPRVTYDNTGTLTAGFVSLRPFEIFSDDPKAKSPFSLFARYDSFKPFSDQRSAGPTTGTQTTSSANTLLIAGASWDLNSKATFSIDYQDLSPQSGSTTLESKILFVHFQISF
jgi:hypothetical protein